MGLGKLPCHACLVVDLCNEEPGIKIVRQAFANPVLCGKRFPSETQLTKILFTHIPPHIYIETLLWGQRISIVNTDHLYPTFLARVLHSFWGSLLWKGLRFVQQRMEPEGQRLVLHLTRVCPTTCCSLCCSELSIALWLSCLVNPPDLMIIGDSDRVQT